MKQILVIIFSWENSEEIAWEWIYIRLEDDNVDAESAFFEIWFDLLIQK